MAPTSCGIDGGLAGVTIISVGTAPPRGPSTGRPSCSSSTPDGALHSTTIDDRARVGRADALSLAEAESVARRLAPLRLAETVREQAPLAVDHDLTELLGIADIATAERVHAVVGPPGPGGAARSPSAPGPDGAPVELDLKEAAQDGMGPHGLIVGATGSGKSELLRTLVLGLAVTHSPETLNFVLVDFKGGATFASLDGLPHTSAVITNLADELPLVDRMTRRHERRADPPPGAAARGPATSPRCATTTGPGPPARTCRRCRRCCWSATSSPRCSRPSPTSSTCSSRSAGSAGRSGSTCCWPPSDFEEGRLRGLETNLSYRIALRTFTAHESRMTLGGASDAAELPSAPGHGFLRVGTEPLQRFKAAYVVRAVPADAGRRRAPARRTWRDHDPGLHQPARPGPARSGRPEPAAATRQHRRHAA